MLQYSPGEYCSVSALLEYSRDCFLRHVCVSVCVAVAVAVAEAVFVADSRRRQSYFYEHADSLVGVCKGQSMLVPPRS